MHAHAVIWIDHQVARITSFDRDTVEKEVVHPGHGVHRHVRAGSRSGARPPADTDFFKDVADAMKDVGTFLIVGPANAKTEFAKYLREHQHLLAARLSGVEPMDHVTDGELLTAAVQYFKKADWKMPAQTA